MTFIASIVPDSGLDIELKSENLESYTLFGNFFELKGNTYICTKIVHLIPLLDLSYINVLMYSNIPKYIFNEDGNLNADA